MTVTSVALMTTKFLLRICDCTVDSDVGTGDFLLMLRILHVWTQALVITHVSGHGLQKSYHAMVQHQIQKSIH